MRPRFLLLAAIVAAALLLPAGGATASEFDRDEAGNPVRMAGTLGYPAGYALEYLWFRPLHWLGQRTPCRQVFGQDTFDEAYN